MHVCVYVANLIELNKCLEIIKITKNPEISSGTEPEPCNLHRNRTLKFFLSSEPEP